MHFCRQSCVGSAQATVSRISSCEEARAAESRTTVVLRNLPLRYTSSKLIRTIDLEGFAGMYDFIYVPMNFKARTSYGYGFVNLIDALTAQRFREAFEGFSRWSSKSKNVCRVVWATKQQGLQANIHHYGKSTVMMESVPPENKPRIFRNGVEIPFPLPYRKSQQHD
eukprot:TRINITY_DN17683_c0_g2_i1.p1 TRINITY_DN17683_c0_g2~~TRINITY_DN17683_c0_g2_i1.p1  ORF type:complete len:167 (-),score=11.65 TRINITY_DN17683_c0_g2_i1:383-883(-)